MPTRWSRQNFCSSPKSLLLVSQCFMSNLSLTTVRVPKELISRFVKICPTCQVRRGTSRNSPTDEDKEMDFGEDDEKLSKSRRPSHMNQDENQTQSFESTVPYTTQNRWLSGFEAPSAQENMYTSSTPREGIPYAGFTDALEEYENERDRSHRSSHSRHASDRSSKFKQESSYRY